MSSANWGIQQNILSRLLFDHLGNQLSCRNLGGSCGKQAGRIQVCYTLHVCKTNDLLCELHKAQGCGFETIGSAVLKKITVHIAWNFWTYAHAIAKRVCRYAFVFLSLAGTYASPGGVGCSGRCDPSPSDLCCQGIGVIQLHRLHSLIDLFYAAAVQTFCLATSNLGGTMDSQSLVVNLVQMGAPKAGWCEMKLPIYVSDLLIDNVCSNCLSRCLGAGGCCTWSTLVPKLTTSDPQVPLPGPFCWWSSSN